MGAAASPALWRPSITAGWHIVLFAVLATTGATEVRWANPDRGPIRGGVSIYVKGTDFKHAGLGLLRCRFHRIEVPAKVVSATLVQCTAPAVDKPAAVPLRVVREDGGALPGADLDFQYFDCDAQVCHIGEYVPAEQPLFDEDDPQDSLPQPEAPSTEESARDDAPAGAQAGPDDGWGSLDIEDGDTEEEDGADASLEAIPAQQLPGSQPVSPEIRQRSPIPPNTAHTSRPVDGQRVAPVSHSPVSDPGAGNSDERRELSHQTATGLPAAEPKRPTGEPGKRWGLLDITGATALALAGLYLLRLGNAAINGVAKSPPLLQVSSNQNTLRINTKHLDSGGKETTIEAERSDTTSSTPRIQRANSSRPNERGIRGGAALKRSSTYGDEEDEEVPLGHLRWLLGADATALQKLQGVLSQLSSGEIGQDQLLDKLQGFDARRLLHSEGVCAKTLAHAGLSQEQAEAVARELYGTSTPGSPRRLPAIRSISSAPVSPRPPTSPSALRRPGQPPSPPPDLSLVGSKPCRDGAGSGSSSPSRPRSSAGLSRSGSASKLGSLSGKSLPVTSGMGSLPPPLPRLAMPPPPAGVRRSISGSGSNGGTRAPAGPDREANNPMQNKAATAVPDSLSVSSSDAGAPPRSPAVAPVKPWAPATGFVAMRAPGQDLAGGSSMQQSSSRPRGDSNGAMPYSNDLFVSSQGSSLATTPAVTPRFSNTPRGSILATNRLFKE